MDKINFDCYKFEFSVLDNGFLAVRLASRRINHGKAFRSETCLSGNGCRQSDGNIPFFGNSSNPIEVRVLIYLLKFPMETDGITSTALFHGALNIRST